MDLYGVSTSNIHLACFHICTLEENKKDDSSTSSTDPIYNFVNQTISSSTMDDPNFPVLDSNDPKTGKFATELVQDSGVPSKVFGKIQ